jgi:amino acid permease
VISSLLILGSCCAIGIYLPNIVVIWSFLGSTLCCGIAFILPPFIYLKLRGCSILEDTASKKAFALLVFGVIASVVCTIESALNASG